MQAMLVRTIPFPPPDRAHALYQVTLHKTDYILEFRRNRLDEYTYLGIYTIHEEPILVGMRLFENEPLLWRFRDPRLPPGDLVPIVESTPRPTWVLAYVEA